MAVLPIRIYPDPSLRKKCAPVGEIDDHLRELASRMVETLRAAPGAGLAAPQVGEGIRLVVVDLSVGEDPDQLHILLNPEVERAEGEQFEEEGCLSLPNVLEKVRRPARLRVRALNLEGREVLLDAGGALARVLQHEIGHLDGTLLFDHLNRLKRDAIKRRLRKQAKAASVA